eukprot:2399258-Prymnesium_polylepis.1
MVKLTAVANVPAVGESFGAGCKGASSHGEPQLSGRAGLGRETQGPARACGSAEGRTPGHR